MNSEQSLSTMFTYQDNSNLIKTGTSTHDMIKYLNLCTLQVGLKYQHVFLKHVNIVCNSASTFKNFSSKLIRDIFKNSYNSIVHTLKCYKNSYKTCQKMTLLLLYV